MAHRIWRLVAEVGLIATLAVGASACGSSAPAASDTTTTVPESATTVAPSPSSSPTSPSSSGGVVGFELASFTVTDSSGTTWPLCLWLAATRSERARGLMYVTDESLGGADGMAFLFDDTNWGAFWMRNTPIPLSIAFFDAEGRFVGSADMDPCGDRADCPRYDPKVGYRYAVEVPVGGLAARGIGSGSVLRDGGAPCPNRPTDQLTE